MTKTIRISDEDYAIIEQNADGRSMAEEVHRMLTNVTDVTKVTTNITNVIPLTRNDFDHVHTDIYSLIERLDRFMSHGQGGIRVYPMPVEVKEIEGKKMIGKVLDRTERDLGFRTASEFKKEDVPINVIQEVK